ncbi:Sodium/hydrogen exchanger [Aphis craccivora]|uniref:Sodium/hydrogen exchanger n=1 Tax=Aphis craccivora TaxID=307492 RepID=A0A6G0YQR0_APHCR|nr:Sodium/hydrogen exchanger [Aphis craccivora]
MQSLSTPGFLIPADCRNPRQSKLKHLKRYTVNGLFALVACVLMYRDWATSESSAAEIAFRILPQYVQILITLLVDRTLSGWSYWAVTSVCLFSSNWLRLLHRDSGAINWEDMLQIFLCFIPLLSEIHFCRMCAEFKKSHHNLNIMVADGCNSTAKLSAVRAQRKALIDRTGKMISSVAYGAQILMVIGTTAAAAVFEVHRALLSTERSRPAADLLDVLQRFLRLFALCKVSGDVGKVVSKRNRDNLTGHKPEHGHTSRRRSNALLARLIWTALLALINNEMYISFFLWEIENPPAEMRLACGTLVLGPRLFVSVFSWCVGFILILLQFRWPRTINGRAGDG